MWNEIRRICWIAAILVVLVGVTACSSDPEQGSPDDPVSLPPADPSDTSPSSCPFSGGTGPTSGGTQLGTTTVSDVSPSKDGCVDTIQFNFGGPTAKWSAAYATGPVNDASGTAVSLPSGSNLVVTFEDTTYGPATSASSPVTIPPNGLDYVRQATVVPAAGGALQFVMTLDQQLDYLVSSSETPAYVTLAVG
jgi:hypothetical protein